MNKFLILFLIFSLNKMTSQIKNGEVTYATYFLKSTPKTNLEEDLSKKKMNKDLNEKIKLLNSRIEEEAKNLKILLLFNERESSFLCQKKIFKNKNDEISYEIAKITHKIYGVFYYQIHSKNYVKELEFGGDIFLIEKENKINSWNLLNETKKIGIYNCFKAVRDFNYSDKNNQNRTKKQTVWYTPDINVPFGPKNFLGFPGLVLKVIDGTLIYEAKKIAINKEKTESVKKPSKGIIISEYKFDEIVKKSSITFKKSN